MIEHLQPEALETLDRELTVSLSEIQESEIQLASRYRQILGRSARLVDSLGLFPNREAVFDSTARREDIKTIPLVCVGYDAETQKNVFLGPEGELHLCEVLPPRVLGNKSLVYFTKEEKDKTSDGIYVNHTKRAIKVFQLVVSDARKTRDKN